MNELTTERKIEVLKNFISIIERGSHYLGKESDLDKAKWELRKEQEKFHGTRKQ